MEDLKKDWEKYAAPIEFLHAKMLELFHTWRRLQTESPIIQINGVALNNIIAEAKRQTYLKYKDLNLSQPIKKDDAPRTEARPETRESPEAKISKGKKNLD